MKILYVCHRFPFPPKRGGKIRPFNMIKHLSADHEVTVASLVRSRDEAGEGDLLALLNREGWHNDQRIVAVLKKVEVVLDQGRPARTADLYHEEQDALRPWGGHRRGPIRRRGARR